MKAFNMILRKFGFIVLGILMLCWLTFSTQAKGKAEVVTLSGPALWDSAPLLELVKTQPLKDQNIIFAFKPWKLPPHLRANLLNGEVDLAIVPSISAALFHNKGIALSVLFSHNIENNLVVVGRGDAMGNFGLPKSEQIAVPFKGDMPDFIYGHLGGNRNQAIFVKTPVEATQLILAGKLDNAFLAEPLATIATTTSNEIGYRLDVCKLWRKRHNTTLCPPIGLLAAAPHFQNEERLKVIADAYSKAFDTVAKNPDRAAHLIAEAFPNLAQMILVKAFAKLEARLETMQSSKSDLKLFLKAIDDQQPAAIGGKIPDAAFFGVRDD